MKKIGISNYHIIEYIYQKFGTQITSLDIAKLINQNNTVNISETQMLEDCLKENDKYFIYRNEDQQIAAIFSLTQEENDNYSHFGDFISIDGTNIPNNLNWTTIPIALENNHCELVSGGLAFCSSETKEFYNWLFDILFNLFPQIKCVISDEDTSILSSLYDFPNVSHILCSKHKIANIYKQINIKNYSEGQLLQFKQLINQYFYSRSRSKSDEALNSLYNNFPEIQEYFENYVVPLSDHYIVSKLPQLFFLIIVPLNSVKAIFI